MTGFAKIKLVGEVILLLLIALWFLGYITVPGIAVPRFPILYFRGRPITLWDILIFLIVIWAIEELPDPFRTIFAVMLLLWVLSTVGIISIVGFPHLLVIGLIVGMAISIFSGGRTTS